MSTSKTVVLISSDGEKFEVEEAVAKESEMIKNMIEDGCAGDAIPLPNVSSNTLAKILQYCRRHVEDEALKKSDSYRSEDIRAFDSEFANVDESALCELVLAANFLNIKSLFDTICQAIADIIKDKSPEEVRKLFGVVNDFTPEEEEDIRQQNAWVFK